MSRIGRLPITVPAGVDVKISDCLLYTSSRSVRPEESVTWAGDRQFEAL